MIFQKRVREGADNRFRILQITKVLMSHKNILTYNLGRQSLSGMFHLVHFVKWWQIFLQLNSKGLYQSSGKEKESRCLVFTFSTKREIRQFHVVVVQRRRRNVQKSVMHVQSCCFPPPPRTPSPPCKGIQDSLDSTQWTPDSNYWIPHLFQ